MGVNGSVVGETGRATLLWIQTHTDKLLFNHLVTLGDGFGGPDLRVGTPLNLMVQISRLDVCVHFVFE